MEPNVASREMVRQRFEREAESFDAIYREDASSLSYWLNRVLRRGIFERYETAFREAGDVRGQSILDVGCGSGIYVVSFAQRGARRVVGLDFSRNMLELAQRAVRRHGYDARCEFRHADFMDARIDETFDLNIAMGVFDYLPDPAPFLRKMVSVTKGKVIASFPTHSIVRSPARRLRYRVTGKGDVYFYDEAQLHRLVREAGLTSYSLLPAVGSGGGFVLVGRCTS